MQLTIVYQYAHGDAIKLSMSADAEHPDALDELTTRVLKLYREAVAETTDEAE
jgi:hypothetical protein